MSPRFFSRRSRPVYVMAISGVLLSAVVATAARSGATSSPQGASPPAARPVTLRQCPRERIEVVALRGAGVGTRSLAGHSYTEDTVPAFEAAMRNGADGFETDYWPTRDQRIVSLHDDTLARTTSGTGQIWTRQWSYVRRVVTPSGSVVPTVATVESAMHRFGGLRQQEIKKGAYFSDQLLERLFAVDRRYDSPRDVLLTASEPGTLLRIHQLDPAFATGYIVRSSGGRPALSALPPWLTFVLIDLRAADRAYVARAHVAGHLVSVRGVDTVSQLHRAVAMGVDRVVTDYPDVLGHAC